MFIEPEFSVCCAETCYKDSLSGILSEADKLGSEMIDETGVVAQISLPKSLWLSLELRRGISP